MRAVRQSSDDEMVVCFLRGELMSERFGAAVRQALRTAGEAESLLLDPDLTDQVANGVRADLLGQTRGYRRGRDVFDETFPRDVSWIWADLTPHDLSRVRYIEYSYWNELSGGTRLPGDAVGRIRADVRAFDVPHDRFLSAERFLRTGGEFPPLILVGPDAGALVCLEGNLRLTAHALAGFPMPLRCLVGTARSFDRWCR